MAIAGADIDVTPSIRRTADLSVATATELKDGTADAIGYFVAAEGPVPPEIGIDRATLNACGFDGNVGDCLVVPGGEMVKVAVGYGVPHGAGATRLRDAAACFARAVPGRTRLALHMAGLANVDKALASEAVVEGAVLARYRFSVAQHDPGSYLDALQLLCGDNDVAQVEQGAERGRVIATATALGRDLANCPAGYLTATRLAEVARDVAGRTGLSVEVFDKAALIELGCGGLLGVNAGSVEPPAMVKLSYRPGGDASGHLGLVGKGVMYDSGGIALKGADPTHATMKNDMTGAGVILAAMSTLRGLGCQTAVTGWLMCTDNMPSGSATRLGDVLTMRGGKRVEVLNTDAEGRLVMADAIVLATEDGVDAIVDIATLTGQCLRTFGTEIAGVMGNDAGLVDQVKAAGDVTDEPVWELPLATRYRKQLDSDVADLANLGGPNAGSITAALFLAEFVGDTPWAHIDIAGTAQADAPRTWRNKGATGFGTPLLIELATRFQPPTGDACPQ
jgi:leucyl aminopeptidase